MKHGTKLKKDLIVYKILVLNIKNRKGWHGIYHRRPKDWKLRSGSKWTAKVDKTINECGPGVNFYLRLEYARSVADRWDRARVYELRIPRNACIYGTGAICEGCKRRSSVAYVVRLLEEFGK